MKIIDYINRTDKPFISFEVIPPARGGNAQELLRLITKLSAFNPPFIDVTSHPSEVIYEESPVGIKKKVKRKRPGTLGICAIVQFKFLNIEAVPHILCKGFTREETEDFLIDIHYLGIENIFAVQGDISSYKKPINRLERTINKYAEDLVTQITNMNRGIYLDNDTLNEPSNFCIGVAGYPEKHFESPNLLTNIKYTKKKVDAGASYIVTQMVFDNKKYHDYVNTCRKNGIEVPIIPGLKILSKKTHLKAFPSRFFVDIPCELSDKVLHSHSEDDVIETGIEWALHQVEDLISQNVPGIHFYVTYDAIPIYKLMERMKDFVSLL